MTKAGLLRWLALWAAVGPAGCSAQSADVSIDTVIETLEGGTFSSNWGDLELECPSGEWNGPEPVFGGAEWSFSGTMVCSDGSGTFVLEAEGEGARPEPDNDSPQGTWTISDGTGDFEGVSGGGDYHLLDTESENFEGSMTLGG